MAAETNAKPRRAAARRGIAFQVLMYRGAGIRTRGLLLPKQARYQAALRPASSLTDAPSQYLAPSWALRDSNP